jgi:tetratricopeptide (TPR) repeat protein
VIERIAHGYLVQLDALVHPIGCRPTLSRLPRAQKAYRAVCPSGELEGAVIGGTMFAVLHVLDHLEERVLLSTSRAGMARPETAIRLGMCQSEDGRDACVRPPFVEELRRRATFYNPDIVLWLEQRWAIAPASSLVSAWHQVAHPEAKCCHALRRRQDVLLADAKVAAGVLHQKAGRKDEALVCYERALQVQRDSANALVARGALRTTNEEYGCLPWLDTVGCSALRVTLTGFNSPRGVGRFDNAVEDLREAIRINPKHRKSGWGVRGWGWGELARCRV